MATIRKKGKTWHCQIRKKGFPTVTKTFRTKSNAESWAKIAESEMVRGVYTDTSEAESTTLREALERYQVEVSAHKKSHNNELSTIRLWKERPLADSSLASIRQVDIAKYRDERIKEVGPASVRNELALLSHLFTIAATDWNMGIQNPVLNVRKPKPNKPRERRLSEDELQRIIAATESSELPAIIRLLTETAMRRGEVFSLRWDTIDLKKQTAHLLDTKNGESRYVPLSKRAIETLTSLPRRIDGNVFGITPNAATRAFSRARTRAKIENATLHDLRHEAVSRLFEDKGLKIMEVASVSGHKSLSMLKRYTHLSAEIIAQKLG